MADDSFGVILILVLGGLVVPIALLIAAAVLDVILVAWSLARTGYDGVAHAATHVHLPRPVHRLGH